MFAFTEFLSIGRHLFVLYLTVKLISSEIDSLLFDSLITDTLYEAKGTLYVETTSSVYRVKATKFDVGVPYKNLSSMSEFRKIYLREIMFRIYI